MPSLADLTVFGAAALVLLVIPGPVVLYTLARSINEGRRAGLTSVLAVGIGDLCHVVAAAVGLSAVLLASAVAFDMVRYAGVVYLIYLGVRTLLADDQIQEVPVGQPARLARVFSQGVLVAVLNPKTALFFLAFLPQFVDPSRGNAIAQVVVLGALFVVMGMVTNSVWALASSTAGAWLRGNRGFARSQRYFAGGAYLTLGVVTAIWGGHQSR